MLRSDHHAHDPAQKSSGDSVSERYRALLDSIDQGFCVLEMLFDPSGEAADYRFLEVNAAFEGLTGLRNPVGLTMRELGPLNERIPLAAYGRVARTGRPERFVHQAPHLDRRWYDIYAFRIDGHVGVLFSDITERKKIQRRQAYLLGLGDALRPLTDPLDIQAEASRRLGEELGADRAYYCEVDEAAGRTRVSRCHLRGDSPSLVGEHRASGFTWTWGSLRAGQTLVVPDVTASPLVSATNLPPLAAARVAALVKVPLVKDGVLVGAMTVTEPAPRAWADDEVELVRLTGDHIWAAVERARAESAVRASEARFRAFADTAPAMLWVTEADGACTFVSRGWREFTGQSEAIALGFGWLDAVHPDDRADARATFLAANARQEPFALEHRIRRFTGEYRWVIDAGRPRPGPDGAFLGYIGSVIDIDDRKRAEAEMFRSREAMRAVLDTIPQRVFWKAPDLTYLGCNRPFARDMGFESPHEVVGKNDYQGAWAESAEAFRADDRRVIDTGTPKLDYEEVLVAADGSRQWVRTSKQPLRGPDGRVSGVLGTYEDVTERHRLEERLREQEELLRETSEMAHIGGWSFDPVTGQSDWTEETFRIHNLDPKAGPEPVQQGVTRFPDRDRIGAAVLAAREHGTPYDLELRFIAADGEQKWVRAICRPVVEGGKVVRVRGTLQDVTARHELEEKLRQSQKMDAFGQLAGGVAHDFNNMLQVINGYAAMLLKELPAADPNVEPVSEIRKAGERSAALTRQLLAFARQEVVAPRVLDLSAAAGHTTGMLRRLIGEDVRLVTDLGPGVWPVFVDPGQLEQILLNLAVNARDAMPDGGTLTVAARNEAVTNGEADVKPGQYAVLSVADTGKGMPPEVMARIFEPFFTTKEVGQGTGLGLATVYGIIRQAGGHVRVRSTVGAGNTFDVFLPRAADAGETFADVPGVRPVPRGAETVLVVEDEAAVRGLVKMVLSGSGYKVLLAGDAAAAERVAEEHTGPIHLVLSDVVMPGAGGRAAAAGVTAKHPEAKVVFMSGYTDDAVMRRGVSAADVPFIQKPFEPDVLAAKVREVLDSPH